MRVVSLVPSVTESIVALGVAPVACTRFCEQPGLPTVGGTKNPDIQAITDLRPDLVIVNDEENRREDADALSEAGIRLLELSPRHVADVGGVVRGLGHALDVAVPGRFAADAWEEWLADQRPAWPPRPAFVPVWRRPWMTLAADTYGASLLALCGFTPVGGAAGGRYPETTLADVADEDPLIAVLPTEPYEFTERHVTEVAEELGVSAVLVDGQDLFWWGVRTPDALERLRATLADADI
ncbi:MAG: helical backbone metal receptor [Acidimicrobiia bacterium]